MGADEAVLIAMPENGDYHITSLLLTEAIKKSGGYTIILCGEASIDQFSGQIGPRIAGFLNIPQITYAQSVTVENGKIVVDRNMGDKVVTEESTFPVLITVTKEINKPRLPSLMQIMASTKKPIHDWTVESLGISGLNPKVETIDIKGVSMERKNIVLPGSIEEATDKLAESLAKEGVF
jgi:electron transfer flavoprotein beta subunit